MNISRTALATLALSALTFAGDITWQTSLEEASRFAANQNKVVFIAVNMDDEKANDRMAEKVYHDKVVTKLAEHTLNLIASAFEHSKNKCSRFGTSSCLDHQKVDVSVRKNVLKPDAEGFVVAPQHVFLGPKGDVILSVPYEISAAELEWCFVTAIRTVAPDFEHRMSAGARAPKRLILGDVYDPEADQNGSVRPLTRDELLALIKEVKKGMGWNERLNALRRIVTSEENEALDFVETELRSGTSGGGGGMGRGGGRGGRDLRPGILHAIGVFGAKPYWTIVAEYADTSDERIRSEAIVALEQLAAPDSLKIIQKLVRKEKDPRLKKNWYRAMGAAGAADARARKALIKAANAKKEDLTIRCNAIFALGYLAAGDDVTAALNALLASDDPKVRGAACLAMGLTRNEVWKDTLKKTLDQLDPEAAKKRAAEEKKRRAAANGEGEPEEDPDEGEKPEGRAEEAAAEKKEEAFDLTAVRAALKVLEGGPMRGLRGPVKDVCNDTIERERLFGFGGRGGRDDDRQEP